MKFPYPETVIKCMKCQEILEYVAITGQRYIPSFFTEWLLEEAIKDEKDIGIVYRVCLDCQKK